MIAHTPGEWVTGGESDPLSILSTPTYGKVAEVNDALSEAHANARLLAAAPDMYEALLLVKEALRTSGMSNGAIRRAESACDAAIAKARSA